MSKKNLVWGIVLFAVFGIALLLFCIFVGDLVALIAIDSGAIAVIILWAVAVLALGFVSHYILSKYRTDSGDKGVVSSIFYFISFIPYGVAFAVLLLIFGIYKFIKAIMDNSDGVSSSSSSSSSSSTSTTKYTVKDENGREIELEQYGSSFGSYMAFKDEKGQMWESDDYGKTAKRK